MRKFCWVYYDQIADEIVLVQKPYRREVNPTYACFIMDGDAGVRDYFHVESKHFRGRFQYLGGLNTSIRSKRTKACPKCKATSGDDWSQCQCKGRINV